MELPVNLQTLSVFLLLGLAATVEGCTSNQTVSIDFSNGGNTFLYFNSSNEPLSEFSTDKCWKVKVGSLNELTIWRLSLDLSCTNSLTIHSGESSNSTILRGYCVSNIRTPRRVFLRTQYIFLWLRRNSSFGEGFEISFDKKLDKKLPPVNTNRPTEVNRGLIVTLVGSIVPIVIIIPFIFLILIFVRLKMAGVNPTGNINSRNKIVTVFFKYTQCCGLGCYHYRFFTETGVCVGLRINPFPEPQFHGRNERFPPSISDQSYPIAKCKLRAQYTRGNRKKQFYDVTRLNEISQHSARVSCGTSSQQMQVSVTGLPNYQNSQSFVQTAPSDNVYHSIYDTVEPSNNIYNSVYNEEQTRNNVYGSNYNNFSSAASVNQSIFDSSSTTVNVTSLPAVENRAYQPLPATTTQVRK